MEILLRNITEEIVLRKIEQLRNNLNCCKCEQCRLDIASYTLNRLPAKYVVTTQGELLSRLDSLEPQYEATLTTTILQGAMLVNMYPHHQNND